MYNIKKNEQNMYMSKNDSIQITIKFGEKYWRSKQSQIHISS